MNENSSGLSPWKKPRSVVLTKSKSMKRKSKSFSVDLDSDFDDNESKSKVQNSPLSVIIENRNFTSNIFSVPRLSTNHKTDVSLLNEIILTVNRFIFFFKFRTMICGISSKEILIKAKKLLLIIIQL